MQWNSKSMVHSPRLWTQEPRGEQGCKFTAHCILCANNPSKHPYISFTTVYLEVTILYHKTTVSEQNLQHMKQREWCIQLLLPETLKKAARLAGSSPRLGTPSIQQVHRRIFNAHTFPFPSERASCPLFPESTTRFLGCFFIENLNHKTPHLDYFCLCAFKFMDKHKIAALF